MTRFNKNTIITEAKQIKQYIEKNKKLPKSCTLNTGTTISPYTITYLMSTLILNPKNKDYETVPVIKYNQKKITDTINEKVTLKDYLQMISNFTQYCKNNKRVPTYITTIQTKTKVSYELYTYCLTKIINFYKENNYLPNYCLFNKADLQNNTSSTLKNNKTTSTTTSNCTNKYNKEKGCEAMGQNNSYYCGVSAVQKVLYKFGINESQKTLATWAGTTTAGTSHNGIRTAIAKAAQKHKINLTVNEANFTDYTLNEIKNIICNPNKDIIWHILYRGKYGHYEKVKSINTTAKTFEVINSLGTKCDYGCYCGYIEKRTLEEQKKYINGISQKSLIIITKK